MSGDATSGASSCEPSSGEKNVFRYTVKNEIKDPCFNLSVDQIITDEKPLEYYMSTACDKYPNVFTTYSATYFPTFGFFIDSINGLAGDWTTDKSSWEILNSGQPLSVGVSLFVPKPGDKILFNFTKRGNCNDQETTTETPSNRPVVTSAPKFRFTVRNETVKPYFSDSVNLSIEDKQTLIYYMKKACDISPKEFKKFSATYYPKLGGYFIDSINDLPRDRNTDKSYWRILNFSQPLSVGVSSYVPNPDDEITFNFE